MLSSERVQRQPFEARWLYVTILLSADDVGLFEVNLFKLARDAAIDDGTLPALIQMLADRDLIRLYESGGKRYGFVPRFRQRLQIKRTKFPMPPLALMSDDEDAVNKIKDLTANPPLDNGGSRKPTVVQPSEPEPEPEEKKKNPHTPAKRGRAPSVSLKTWLEAMKAKGEKPVPEDDQVFAYAESVGIPTEFLRLAWLEFRHRYTQPEAKRYSDWRIVFRKAVRGNWLKLWWMDTTSQEYALTTVGQQAQRAHEERKAAA